MGNSGFAWGLQAAWCRWGVIRETEEDTVDRFLKATVVLYEPPN